MTRLGCYIRTNEMDNQIQNINYFVLFIKILNIMNSMRKKESTDRYKTTFISTKVKTMY